MKAVATGFCIWALFETATGFADSIHGTQVNPALVEDASDPQLTLLRMQNARAVRTASKTGVVYGPVVMAALSYLGIKLGRQTIQHVKKGFAKTQEEKKEAAPDATLDNNLLKRSNMKLAALFLALLLGTSLFGSELAVLALPKQERPGQAY